MRYFRVRNLRKFQKYKDRSPVWICVYMNTREKVELDALHRGLPVPTDAEMWQMVAIIMLAAQLDDPLKDDGPAIPYDKNWIQKRCRLDSAPNLDKFMALGMLQSCNDPVTSETYIHTNIHTGREGGSRDFPPSLLASPKQIEMLEGMALAKNRSLKTESFAAGCDWPLKRRHVDTMLGHLRRGERRLESNLRPLTDDECERLAMQEIEGTE